LSHDIFYEKEKITMGKKEKEKEKEALAQCEIR
jgi:hypothetical protein